jgi:hypothetical protein
MKAVVVIPPFHVRVFLEGLAPHLHTEIVRQLPPQVAEPTGDMKMDSLYVIVMLKEQVSKHVLGDAEK